MGNTVLGLFGVCIAAALSELLLPSDEGQGTKAVLRVLVSLAVLLLLIRPVLPYLRIAPNLALEELVGESEDTTAHYQEIFERAVRLQSEGDLKAGLLALLDEEYGIAEDEAYIKVYFEDTGALVRVEIYLSGKALLQDPDVLAADISARLGCETEVR
jgi:hypothetical protein